MLKTLFKKQMLQVNKWFFQDTRTGKRRSKSGLIMYALLYLFVFATVSGMFFVFSDSLCGPLISLNMEWLYFSIMGMVSLAIGVFGSIFSTYSSLYNAKDNEMLLSLPIPVPYILTVRLFGVWLWGLIYEALVFIPAIIVYSVQGSQNFLSVLFQILLIFVISLIILTVSCILGWLVAKISARFKNKSMITVIVSLAFFGGYYYIYFRAQELLQQFVLNAVTIGINIKNAAYPIYALGRAAQGDFISFVLIAAAAALMFAAVYFVLLRSFLKIATSNYGAAKTKYREKSTKKKSVEGALFLKELKRFLSSPVYMLNCALGTIMLIFLAVMAIVKIDTVREILDQLKEFKPFLTLIACAAISLLSTMNDITAPSISLEGKNLWVLQSLPVSSWQVLKSKINLHLVLTEIPTLICSVCVIIAIKADLLSAFYIILLPMLLVVFLALFGITANLKSPNLTWTNETVPVKQSLSVLVSMMSGWVLVALLAVLYYLVMDIISAEIYLLFCLIVIIAIIAGLFVWIKNKGVKIFEAL